MTKTQQVWTSQFNALADALNPWVRTAFDGQVDFQYVADDAPKTLTVPYNKMMNVGYAMGWL